MKKNLRIGLLASLLLAPGVIAHANTTEQMNPGASVQQQVPYNTFASSSTKESLTKIYANLDENYSSANILYYQKLYQEMSKSEKEFFTEDEYLFIGEKIDYLVAFIKYKNDATSLKSLISKLSDSSKTLIPDTLVAQQKYSALIEGINNKNTDLSNAAGNVGDPAFGVNLLSSLTYYNADIPADTFIEATLTTEMVEKYASYIVKIEEPNDFIDTYIQPILELNTAKTVDAQSYKDAVSSAREAYENLADSAKKMVGTHTVLDTLTATKVLTNAESDIEKAKAVETAILEIEKTNFDSASKFKSKVSSVTSAYAKLSELQKQLVENYSALEPLASVIKVIDAIAALKPAPTQDYRELFTKAEDLFETITDTELKSYITNAATLEPARENITEAEKVEQQIAIMVENGRIPNATEIADARKAYNALTPDQKKVFLKEIYTILQDWEKNNSTAAAVIKQITAIEISINKTFSTKVSSAQAAYDKLGNKENKDEVTDKQKLVTNYDRLVFLKPFADTIAVFNNLKVTDESYATTISSLITTVNDWTFSGNLSADNEKLENVKAALLAELKQLQGEAGQAISLVTVIEELKTTVDLSKMSIARETYKDLGSAAKKLVINIKDLTALEKQYKAALNVVVLIDNLPGFTEKSYAKKVIAVETAYNKVPKSLQSYATNYALLEGESGLLAIAKSMVEIDALKASAKGFKSDLEKARSNYDKIVGSNTAKLNEKGEPVAAIDQLIHVYGPKLFGKENVITLSGQFDQEITALKALTGEDFMKKLEELTTRYKELDSDIKKNLLHAKDLTALEKDYKAALKVYNLIVTLPATTDKVFPKKVEAAEKAYQKLTSVQKGYVYNYITELLPVLKVADLIGRIEALKISSKNYEIEIVAIRAEYTALSETDQALVHNYKKLGEAESNLSNATSVIALIDAALPNAEDYIGKLIAARNAYDSLAKDQQKLVLNYKELTTREKSVKPVLALDSLIIELNPANSQQFISKYKSAMKAYEKLSHLERSLLTKEDELIKVLQPLFNVMEKISMIKASSKTFVGDTQTARKDYNALTSEQQALISNYNLLLDHELNVKGGANVDALIKALSSNDPQEYIQKVKEARDAYNALSSANKKAVTLADTLKEEEKYIKPVQTVIELIDGLSNPRNDLSKQYDKVKSAMQKLTTEQLSFVTNLNRYSDLTNVIHVYQLIAKLKPSDKYYLGNLQAAKLAYEKLPLEDKQRVTNAYKLQEAEKDVDEIQQVITLIASLSSNSSSYFTDITNALAAYKRLPSATKKQVSNYPALQEAEKNMKAVQKVIDLINALDPDLRTFESKTKAAVKAYDKLTDDQKRIVPNYNLLREYAFDLGL